MSPRKKAIAAPVDPVPARLVGELLSLARVAHAQYREHAGRIGRDGKVSKNPDPWVCGAAVQRALRYRLDAESLDPQQTDAAWREDEQLMHTNSAALIAFYCRYLSPPESYIDDAA